MAPKDDDDQLATSGPRLNRRSMAVRLSNGDNAIILSLLRSWLVSSLAFSWRSLRGYRTFRPADTRYGSHSLEHRQSSTSSQDTPLLPLFSFFSFLHA